MNKSKLNKLSSSNIDRIIALAWEDEVPFKSIKYQYGISEADVIKIMRKNIKRSSFKMWRKRVTSRISRKSDKY
ncbi:MAG: TIGR03643 family protein [Candidatus Marinimicrobia bacterium]|nr:TIGR03643 family protein [Candidatus Neomarinimicrobiota bacterium]|tara:strand:- start:289 stop:510 length:222 start_codon:yes stop_codon:yes gene_type:complete